MDVEKILEKYEKREDNLLAILHDIQDAKDTHYLSEDDLRKVGDYLNLPYAVVSGSASFYSMFHCKPRGKYLIRICQSPPCQLMGATKISDELKNVLGIDFNETTEDGLFTLEMTSCLGVCDQAPAMMINEEVYGNLTPEKIREVINLKKGEK